MTTPDKSVGVTSSVDLVTSSPSGSIDTFSLNTTSLISYLLLLRCPGHQNEGDTGSNSRVSVVLIVINKKISPMINKPLCFKGCYVAAYRMGQDNQFIPTLTTTETSEIIAFFLPVLLCWGNMISSGKHGYRMTTCLQG